MQPTKVRYPEGHLVLRNLQRDLPIISHGKGMFLYDQAGKRYIDGSGGALVVSAGHGQKEIVDAISEQLTKVAYVNGTQFTSTAAEELSSQLVAHDPTLGLQRAGFLSSGSEAVEAAVKFVRQYFVELGQEKRTKVIARTPGYHGNTLFALSISGRPHYKKFYGPLLTQVIEIEAPTAYRSPVDYETQGAEYFASKLEAAILREGPDTIAAFFVEPVIGSSAGGAVPPPGYFKRIQEICSKYGVLVIADEILCGSGRVGSFYASSLYGLKPDVLLLGKGVSGGYIPLSAFLVKQAHLDVMAKGTGYFMHAQTYLHAPSMVSAGLAVMDFYKKYNVLENSKTVGAHFHKVLKQKLLREERTWPVGHIDGVGMLAGIEFVQDKTNKTPFERKHKVAERFVVFAQEQGLILWPNTGHVSGAGDLVMLGPPLNSTIQEVEEMTDLLVQVIEKFSWPA